MDSRDPSQMTAAEQVAFLEEMTARLNARRVHAAVPEAEKAELETRVGELEAQLREVLDAMNRAVEAAGLKERAPLRLVVDNTRKQAG